MRLGVCTSRVFRLRAEPSFFLAIGYWRAEPSQLAKPTNVPSRAKNEPSREIRNEIVWISHFQSYSLFIKYFFHWRASCEPARRAEDSVASRAAARLAILASWLGSCTPLYMPNPTSTPAVLPHWSLFSLFQDLLSYFAIFRNLLGLTHFAYITEF